MIKSFIKENKISYEENISLKQYNTYKLDVLCKYILYPQNVEEVRRVIKFLQKNNKKYMFLGNGSNVIFHNKKYDGVIIRLDKLNNMTINGNKIEAESGIMLPKLSTFAIQNSLSGLEFASAIPGQLGASIAMNAGAYNHSMSEIIESILVINPLGELQRLKANELNFSYRNSLLKENKEYVVLSAVLNLEPGNKKEMKEVVKRRIIARSETQPLELPSAGSVFRNPPGEYAGKLIEELGLKGKVIGGAQISEKHANFIVNNNNATGEDIVNLINYVQTKVKENYNIDLILEQIIVE